MQVINLNKGGTIKYQKRYLSEKESNELFEYLRDNIPWEQSDIIVYDKQLKTPRFQCVMADDKLKYKVYSKTIIDWDEHLLIIKEKLEKDLNFKFDYLLLNYYKTGQNYIAWHADNEVRLNTDLIGSISLGQTRKFNVKEKIPSQPQEKYSFMLEDGDLVIMDGYMQRNYKHTVPKTVKTEGYGRINLTFRKS